MPGFSRVALGLSYLDFEAVEADGMGVPLDILDVLEDDCPDYARQALEDAISGAPRDLEGLLLVPEHEREAAEKAISKGMQGITLVALEILRTL